eukprot:gnl/TRDRNA2_/TRDRNA2_161709_c1_seq2.p1 gnl/TRDRNA2_/TRDRNA2_161709_c1~~gnl/TRDRNA2_/TRDRNA2_161709_c1_seq2.p1  ORF type:complete len:352 (+),score=48.41 gnl/TRDRNA2_/TRDRNA2_161709_c1_seq2:75-1130(+)
MSREMLRLEGTVLSPEDVQDLLDEEDDEEHVRENLTTDAKSCKQLMIEYAGLEFATNPVAIPGNIYRAWAFGLAGEGPTLSMANGAILLVQITAPIIIVFYAHSKLDLSVPYEETLFNFEDLTGGWAAISTKLLATVLLFCFLVNEALVVRGEQTIFVKLRRTASVIRELNHKATKDLKEGYLYLGLTVNALSSVLMCAATFFLMLQAVADGNPVDAIMNILGLQFLRKMDDMDGDMGFLGELPWDANAMGKVHADLVSKYRDGEDSDEEDPDAPSDVIIQKYKSLLHDVWYYTVLFMAVLGPILFVTSHVQQQDEDWEKGVGALNSTVQAQLEALLNEVAALRGSNASAR